MKSSLLAVLAVSCAVLLSACGGKSTPPAVAKADADGRSKGFSVDDKAKCAWQGRADREVSESTAAGAMQPNIRRVWQILGQGSDRRKVLVCREVDTNLDGIKDVVRTFSDKGEPMREEADTDYNGQVDSWLIFSSGRIGEEDLDTNNDGKADVWKYYMEGSLTRIKRDTNADGKADVWEMYGKGRLERIGVDTDFDERVDRWDRDEAQIAGETKPPEKTPDADAGAESQKADGGS